MGGSSKNQGNPNHFGTNINESSGQGNGNRSNGDPRQRHIFPAIVVSVSDPLMMNRITARIVNIVNGQISGGLDRDVLDANLVLCMPKISEHIHCRPLVGEMVWIEFENPSDRSSTRYWTGPVRTSQTTLPYETFGSAAGIFNLTNTQPNNLIRNNPAILSLFPQQSDVAIEGRYDADLILRNREAYLVAGKFNATTQNGNLSPNTATPSSLQLIQQTNTSSASTLNVFSQANMVSTNLNFYSPLGKFRDASTAQFEINNYLGSLGSLANSLHPVPLGDNLVQLLDLMIRVILTHIHTPQSPLVSYGLSQQLAQYTVQGKLQDLLSNFVRIN